MRLVLETSKTAFTVTKPAEPKTEFGGTQQKVDRATKRPEWVVEVLAMDAERGEVIRVTVTGDQPKVNQGQPVAFSELEAIPGPTTAATGSHTGPPRSHPPRKAAPPEPRPERFPLGRSPFGERPAIRSRLSTRTERITRCHDQRHYPDHGQRR